MTWKLGDLPSGLLLLLTFGLIHPAGLPLIAVQGPSPDEKSPSGMTFCAAGEEVAAAVVLGVVAGVVAGVVG